MSVLQCMTSASKCLFEENDSQLTRTSQDVSKGVSQKTLFSKKKSGQHPHVPLWGQHKAYQKAFFYRTSPEGQTTQSKINNLYNVDVHSAFHLARLRVG